MYVEHFGLQSLPFENSPDPEFFFDQGNHSKVLNLMTDFVAAGRGLMVVSGPIGAGKTTLSQVLVRQLPANTHLVWLVEPPVSAKDLVMFLAQELRVDYENETRIFIIRDLVNKLIQLKERNDRILLIVDEAHRMGPEVLEGVRILNNFERGAVKLLQIILIGQEELLDDLERPEMRPLKQRVANIINLGHMTPERCREYVTHRLQTAGGDGSIFTELALDMVAHATGGLPRVTNTLCNNAMRSAYQHGRTEVGYQDVHRAAEEMGMGRQTLQFLINNAPNQTMLSLEVQDLESWAAQVRAEVEAERKERGEAPPEEVVPEDAEIRPTTMESFDVDEAVPHDAAPDKPAPEAEPIHEAAGAVDEHRALRQEFGPGKHASVVYEEPPSGFAHYAKAWAVPAAVFLLSLAALGASVYFYGGAIDLDALLAKLPF